MQTFEDVLLTEYFSDVDERRKRAMVMSYYKYGPVRDNYPHNVDAIQTLKDRLLLYENDGNIEYLYDVMNQAMIESKYPRNPKAHYAPKDNANMGLHGFTVKEAERFQEGLRDE